MLAADETQMDADEKPFLNLKTGIMEQPPQTQNSAL